MRRRELLGFAVAAGALATTRPLLGQGRETYAARLGWVPISGAERSVVAGRGAATATLAGSRLNVSGSFEGLPATATAIRLHQGVAVGARGRAIADLRVTGGNDGTFTGEIALDEGQLAALRAGHLYVQVHAATGVPPDNAQLWGWLLQERRR